MNSSPKDPAKPPEGPGRALYGLAGWMYEDWAGIVYPKPRPRGFDPLAYLARYFDTLEINSSFYRIPSMKTVQNWLRRTAPLPGFEFTMKLWQGLTHERAQWDESSAEAFEQAARPLSEAGKLGCILIQFPWSFRATPDNEDWLKRLLDRFAALDLAVEVRHQSWFDEGGILGLLRDRAAAICNIDQPALRHCIALASDATAEHAYIRFHGRNSRNWFRQDAQPYERYDYLYSAEEIQALAQAVTSLKAKAKRVHVITNNHWRGQAAANALQLQAAVEQRPIQAPACLLDHFGGLGPGVIPAIEAAGEQLELF